MPKETRPRLVRMFEGLCETHVVVENPLSSNMQAVAKEILFLMRLRLQEKGIQIPDALHYMGERLCVRYRKPGTKLQKVIQAAIQSPPEVYKAVFPYLDLSLNAPKTESEDTFIRDLLSAKAGQLSLDYIDARIASFLFSTSDEESTP
jgi:hypothetical protein